MAAKFQAPKGTRDLLPPETALWAEVEVVARKVFALYGFHEIRTPIFEDSELFVRGVGETSDIVGKEMYRLTDKAGRDLTLRPESTAAVCRAYVEHGMQSLPQPVRLYYIGPQFRYERPQKGRYRQFHQIGAELLGGRDANSDLEVILLLCAFFRELGFADLTVLLNSVGDEESRANYRKALVAYLEPLRDQLGEDSQRRLETNPLRILDTKNPTEILLLEQGPRLEDHLTDWSRTGRDGLESNLRHLGVSFRREPRLVRGLDYYTNTVFEIVSEGLGAQNALCGGGAYEGLVEQLGGRPTYGVGFAIGQDRLLQVLPAETRERFLARQARPVLVTGFDRGHESGFEAAEKLRTLGIASLFVPSQRNLAALFKMAETTGARHAMIYGDEEVDAGEVTLRDLEARQQRRMTWDEALDELRNKGEA